MISSYDNKSWRPGKTVVEQKFCTMRERQRERERKEEEDHTINLQFNFTFYSIFSKLKNILAAINFLLKPDKINSWALENVSKKKNRTKIKGYLAESKSASIETEEGLCTPCNKPRCEICKHITKTHQLESLSTKPIHPIIPQNLNCTSKNVVCLFRSKTWLEHTKK